MNLDDLKDKWADYDRKLESSIRLNVSVLRQSVLRQVNSSLQRLFRFIVVELCINCAMVIWLGMFIGNHVGELKFIMPAIALDLFALSLVVFGVHQWVALGSVDYSASIVVIQKKLELLRLYRIRATKWTLLLTPLIWIPLLIVTLKGLFGVNAYALFDSGWIAMNLLFGVAMIPLMICAARRYAHRMQRSPIIQRLMNDIAGRNLMAATTYLNELSQFEREQNLA